MGSRVKEDQLRVSVLLKDTVNLLCKNGLAFKNNMKIVGVLGITLDDDDVFVVHINEAMQNPDAIPDESDSPTKDTGRRTPTKRRRRRSSDSVNTPHSKSARRAAVHIKTDPDDIVVEEIKIHDTDSDEGGQSGDDGLNYAISSIRSLDAPGGTEAAGQYTATSTSQPFITGLVPNKSNIADTGQISDNSSFAWDSNAAQGHAGVSGWSGQGADQTMSQMTQQTMSQGAVQGSSQEGMLQPGSSLGSPGSARIGTSEAESPLPATSGSQVAMVTQVKKEMVTEVKKEALSEDDEPGVPHSSKQTGPMILVFECPHEDCSYLSPRRDHLESHLDTNHAETLLHRSQFSMVLRPDRSFERADKDEVHGISVTQSFSRRGVYKYRCEACGMAFRDRRVYEGHMRSHGEVKPYKCPECDKAYAFEPSLRDHLNIHKNVEYTCSICGGKVGSHKALLRHMTKHREAQHTCHHCGAKFKWQQSLKRHLERCIAQIGSISAGVKSDIL